jgi:hypothetical protein
MSFFVNRNETEKVILRQIFGPLFISGEKLLLLKWLKKLHHITSDYLENFPVLVLLSVRSAMFRWSKYSRHEGGTWKAHEYSLIYKAFYCCFYMVHFINNAQGGKTAV